MRKNRIAAITGGIISFISKAAFSLIVVGGTNGVILTSDDSGKNWLMHKLAHPIQVQSMISRTDQVENKYVALSFSPPMVLISNDGINWTEKALDPSAFYYPYTDIIWDREKALYLASDDTHVFTGPNGWDWPSRYGDWLKTHISFIAASQNVSSKIYVTVGGVSSPDSCIGQVTTSSDGVHWEPEAHDFPCLFGVIWADNQFITIGEKNGYKQHPQYGLMTSVDGHAWTWQSIPDAEQNKLISIAYGHNIFVAIGQQDTTSVALTSFDGVHWTIVDDKLPQGLRKISFVDNIFIAIGGMGAIVTSADGVHWSTQKSGTSEALLSIA